MRTRLVLLLSSDIYIFVGIKCNRLADINSVRRAVERLPPVFVAINRIIFELDSYDIDVRTPGDINMLNVRDECPPSKRHSPYERAARTNLDCLRRPRHDDVSNRIK